MKPLMDIGTAFDGNFLTRHASIIGMTGSGKTGLGIVLLEEARRRGIPMIVLDPKGDLGNLLLHEPSEFRKWASDDQIAERTAGILGSGMPLSAVQELSRVPGRIFTPGATYGTPLAVLDAMAPPSGAAARIEEASTMASALLAMAGLSPDPMTEEHAVLSNLLLHHWSRGASPSLAHLVGSVMDPPIGFIGALPLDSFLPPRKRHSLGRKINTLLAAPGFRAWLTGHPLNPDSLFYDEQKAPTCSVLAMAHLSEDERMFFTALLMSRLVSWMRKQPGTGELRAVVYLDEAYGFCPPTKNPPSKKPIMTLLKQARAHGLGVVLATQNPVDLDYKAMSNCGTWLVGTLRTKQDRARIIDAVGESVGLDKKVADHRIASLAKREFMLLDATGRAEQFRSRYALCLLRGPLTREEISTLSGPQQAGTVSGHVVAWHNRSLNIYSLPGEKECEFLHRCERIVVESNEPLFKAILKRYTPLLRKQTELVEDCKQGVRVSAAILASYREEVTDRTGLALVGGILGGRNLGSFASRAVRPSLVGKRRFHSASKAVRDGYVAVQRNEEALERINAEMQEEIDMIEEESYERVLDIVEVKS